MGNLRKFSSAFLVASAVAVVMNLSVASLEAAGKRGSGKGESSVCEYLQAIIDWPYTSEYIKVWALSFYNYYGCGQ